MNDAAGQPRFDRPEDNVETYLAIAKLLPMPLGDTAPPRMPPQHKAHLNHLHVQPGPHRQRFSTLISCRDTAEYDIQIKRFVNRLPSVPLNVPIQDERTGAAFTIPVRGLNLRVPEPLLPRPTTIFEIIPWMCTYPFQTLTRAMQLCFRIPAMHWDITPLPSADFDGPIWQTYVWRRSPPPSDLETYYRLPQNPVPQCSLVICLQPEWILTEADIDAFKRVSSFPPFVENGDNMPYKSAHRIWAKLWDTCTRLKCRYWVLTSYRRWIFGSFSKSFVAGHIFAVKSYDSGHPTIMETLVFHTAKSMGLADDIYIPEFLESTDGDDGPPQAPPHPHNYFDMEFPDSDSEWDEMDEEPDISAGVSDYLDARISAYGSAANVELPIVRVFRSNRINRPERSPPRSAPRRREPLQPIAGPSRLAASLSSLPSSTSSTPSYVAGSPHPPTDSETEVEHRLGSAEMADLVTRLNEPSEHDTETEVLRQYEGVSRATVEVTDAIMSWTENVDADIDFVEDLLRVDEQAENPFTHALGTEPLYYSAMVTLNVNGGQTHLFPRPQQTIHTRRPYTRGGYMNVLPELGTIMEAEELEALERELINDIERRATWRELETVGHPIPDDPNLARDQAAAEPGRDRMPAAAV